MLSLFAILYGILNFRFAPSLNGLIYHGDKVARTELTRNYMPKTVGPGFLIIITSYEMAMFDAKFLANYKWKSHDLNYCPYIFLSLPHVCTCWPDSFFQGHLLKNTKCKLLRELGHVPMDKMLL